MTNFVVRAALRKSSYSVVDLVVSNGGLYMNNQLV